MAQPISCEQNRDALQAALDRLVSWADKWGMAFIVAKCKVMHIGHGNPRYDYAMLNMDLAATTEERDLGVITSSKLKPTAQCAKAAKTAQAVLGQLARAFHFRDRYVLFVQLYTTYVRPHLEFAIQAWSPWTAADKEVLEQVQKRAIIMVSGQRGCDYEQEPLTSTPASAKTNCLHIYIGKNQLPPHLHQQDPLTSTPTFVRTTGLSTCIIKNHLPPHLHLQEPIASTRASARTTYLHPCICKNQLPPHVHLQKPLIFTPSSARTSYLHTCISKILLHPLLHLQEPIASTPASVRTIYLHTFISKNQMSPHLHLQEPIASKPASARTTYLHTCICKNHLPLHLHL